MYEIRTGHQGSSPLQYQLAGLIRTKRHAIRAALLSGRTLCAIGEHGPTGYIEYTGVKYCRGAASGDDGGCQ